MELDPGIHIVTHSVLSLKLGMTRLRLLVGVNVRPGHTGLYTCHTFPRIRVGTWPTPYICITTHSLVELLVQ
jgi:hypothetical protein